MAHGHGEHGHESCKEVFALLSQYLDQELPAATCEEIRAHLADCPPCIEFLESLKKTIGLCRGYDPGERPAPLDEARHEQLRTAWAKVLEKKKRGAL